MNRVKHSKRSKRTVSIDSDDSLISYNEFKYIAKDDSVICKICGALVSDGMVCQECGEPVQVDYNYYDESDTNQDW